ncbi:MAG: hypothetical protein QW835_00430 [Candidatus Hadarchaeum sp.]
MPTYRNNSGEMVFIKDLAFKPFESLQTKYLLNHPFLTKVNDLPYYNPVIKDEKYDGNAGDEVEVSVEQDCVEICIFSFGPRIKVYFNSVQNEPPLYVFERVFVRNNSLYEKMILKFESGGEVNVKQLREKLEF